MFLGINTLPRFSMNVSIHCMIAATLGIFLATSPLATIYGEVAREGEIATLDLSSLLFGAAHIGNAARLSSEQQWRYYTFSLPFITTFRRVFGMARLSKSIVKRERGAPRLVRFYPLCHEGFCRELGRRPPSSRKTFPALLRSPFPFEANQLRDDLLWSVLKRAGLSE